MRSDHGPLEPAVTEVERMHQAIEGWTTGSAPETEQSFQQFASALAPGFMIINPDGLAEDRETIVSRFHGLYGARADRAFRIEIREPSLHQDSADTALITYHEHWFEGAAECSVIIATALLALERERPGGFAWRHLHETWLRAPVAP